MTYKSVLDEFKSILRQTKSNTCISEGYSTTDELSTNPAESKINSCISTMDAVYNSIFSALDCLFNNPDDDYESVDINYQIINAYADASSGYDYYDKDLDEFITKPEYYYVRGNLYDMLPKANEGKYIYSHINQIKDIGTICEYYENLYLKFNESDTDELGNPIPKIKLFWNRYYSEFASKVNADMVGFDVIKNRFDELVPFIRNYKNLFYNASLNISKGENFIAAINKTSIAKKTRLSDSFANVDSLGFSMYSQSLGMLYDLYKKAMALRNSSEKFKEDYYFNNLRNIYYSEIMVYYDFYNKSVEYYNWILSFREQFNI